MNESYPSGAPRITQVAEHFFRHEGARLVATLTAHLGTHQLQLAEDVVQEALVRALQTWPYRGVPDNPAAWLTQTAKNLALDQLRREQRWNTKQDNIAAEHERWLSSPENETHDTFADDTLRMMFVCFHPQLSTEVQTAFALRTLCGLSPAEIGAAFLISEAAIAKRLVREDLCHEAIRLVTLLTAHPATQTPRTFALLALMLLNAARLRARTDDAGNLLRLHEQDRAAWDQTMIQRGIQCLGRAAQGTAISEYHLEAGIAACHSTAPDEASTNWPRILALYDQLLTLKASPVTAMNRAVAVARVHGPQAGMDALDAIKDRSKLEPYHLFHVIRGTFAAELGDQITALTHFRQAGNLATLPAERDFIARRIREGEAAGSTAHDEAVTETE